MTTKAIYFSLPDATSQIEMCIRDRLCAILKDELDRHYYLKTSDVLTDEDRILFTKMLPGQDDNIEDSIRMHSKLLYKHYGCLLYTSRCV